MDLAYQTFLHKNFFFLLRSMFALRSESEAALERSVSSCSLVSDFTSSSACRKSRESTEPSAGPPRGEGREKPRDDARPCKVRFESGKTRIQRTQSQSAALTSTHPNPLRYAESHNKEAPADGTDPKGAKNRSVNLRALGS